MKNEQKDFLYREILNMIQDLGCHFDHHQFQEFVTKKERGEFRLGGKFGFGFKLYKNNLDGYYFAQYMEEETVESKEWIERNNKQLNEIKEWI